MAGCDDIVNEKDRTARKICVPSATANMHMNVVCTLKATQPLLRTRCCRIQQCTALGTEVSSEGACEQMCVIVSVFDDRATPTRYLNEEGVLQLAAGRAYSRGQLRCHIVKHVLPMLFLERIDQAVGWNAVHLRHVTRDLDQATNEMSLEILGCAGAMVQRGEADRAGALLGIINVHTAISAKRPFPEGQGVSAADTPRYTQVMERSSYKLPCRHLALG